MKVTHTFTKTVSGVKRYVNRVFFKDDQRVPNRRLFRRDSGFCFEFEVPDEDDPRRIRQYAVDLTFKDVSDMLGDIGVGLVADCEGDLVKINEVCAFLRKASELTGVPIVTNAQTEN